MELILPLSNLQVDNAGAPLVLPNGLRPVDGASGLDITSWLQGGYMPASFVVYLVSDGTDRSVTPPSGGTATGVEVWTYKANKAKVFSWYLVGTLFGGATVPVPAVNGFAAILNAPLGTRLALAGTPSLATKVSWFAEPLEHMLAAVGL